MIYSEEFKIGQNAERDTTIKGYYRWAIWIEPGSSELAEIESVNYLLHPTFKNRLRTATDQGTSFKIESKGWGEFLIEITVNKKNGEQLRLTHWLSLDDTNEAVNKEDFEGADLEQKKVYISYSKIDSDTAKLLESLLIDLGMEVSSGSHYEAGVPIKDYIEKSITAADLIINIDSKRPTPWHKSELEFAKEKSKEIMSMANILNQKEVKPELNLKGFSDDAYRKGLKTLGMNLKNLKR